MRPGRFIRALQLTPTGYKAKCKLRNMQTGALEWNDMDVMYFGTAALLDVFIVYTRGADGRLQFGHFDLDGVETHIYEDFVRYQLQHDVDLGYMSTDEFRRLQNLPVSTVKELYQKTVRDQCAKESEAVQSAESMDAMEEVVVAGAEAPPTSPEAPCESTTLPPSTDTELCDRPACPEPPVQEAAL